MDDYLPKPHHSQSISPKSVNPKSVNPKPISQGARCSKSSARTEKSSATRDSHVNL
ncbi:hypothetical protein [Mesorhizobium sp.]|uniref:hypothetical protein n=1 Tax=Mesorhizobium sp. TaxID=1871066 RepID=UPI0025FF76ED|nr:hypothetical protein [Mesorhizobium sp.]